MALTWPQFFSISMQLEGLRYRRAFYEVFFGVAAVLNSEAKRNLSESVPQILRRSEAPVPEFTPEELVMAEKRAEEYVRKEKRDVQRG